MKSLNRAIQTYKQQIAQGDIRIAYRGIMDYLNHLRTHLKKDYPTHFVSGSVYQGYMDLSYVAFMPILLKKEGLKIALVFLHEEVKFEIWLAGYNKKIQDQFLKWFKETGYDKYELGTNTPGVFYILKKDLVTKPDFDNLDDLTDEIERGALSFIEEMVELIGGE